MKSKYKLYVILPVGVTVVLLSVLYYYLNLKKIYMVIFHRTGIVSHHNVNGKIDGEFDVYSNGKVIQKAYFRNGTYDGWNVEYYPNGNIKTKSFYKKGELNGIEFTYYDIGQVKSKESFKNGKREGPKITYFNNGQIQQSLFRKNDKDEGTEHAYYQDGKLQYTRNWVNDKLFGDQYFYYEDGKVEIYHTYDILGEKFYISHYDESGKRSQSDGFTFSNHLYSRIKALDSTIVLETNKKYSYIQDLYVTVANPPDSTDAIQIIINHKLSKNLTFLDNNTVKINNAFPRKGVYHISVDVGYIDKSNIPIFGTKGEITIVRSK